MVSPEGLTEPEQDTLELLKYMEIPGRLVDFDAERGKPEIGTEKKSGIPGPSRVVLPRIQDEVLPKVHQVLLEAGASSPDIDI